MVEKYNPKISVIMAVYNDSKFLTESINSILNQTFKDFEFIIINDCSTDNSLKIIQKYAKNDKRIIVIDNNKNLGRAKARNKGLKIAKGKYIAILDSDDIALENRLKDQYEYLESNEETYLIGSRAYNINDKSEIVSKFEAICNYQKICQALPKKNCFYHPSVMFRNTKEVFYREKFPYAQDYDMFLNLLSKGKIITNIPQILIKYRLNPNAVSFTKRAKQKLFAIKAQEFYKERLQNGKDNYAKFNPNEILEIDVNKSTNQIILESEIISNYKLENYEKVRIFAKKYIKIYGIRSKISIYLILSYLNKRILKIIRKII